MKATITGIALFFLFTSAFSQTQESLNNYQFKIDSLKEALSNTKSDSLKCIINFKLSDYYRKWNKIEDYKIHKEIANTLSKKNDYLEGLSYYYNAYDYIIKANYEGYLNNLQEANERLKNYNFKENYSLRASILNNQGPSYQRDGKEKEYYKILVEEAMPLALKSSDPEITGRIYGNIAQISHNNRNYERSEYYYRKAIAQLEKKGVTDKDYLVDCYISYAKKLILLNKDEDVNELMIKIKNKLEQSPRSQLYSKYHFLRGYYAFYKNDYEMALKALNKGVTFANNIKDKRNLLSLKLLKSNTLMQLKRYNEAKPLLIEYLNDPEILIGNKRDFTRNLAEVYIHLNDNKNAIKYFNRFAVLSDSLDEVASRNVISKLEAKFNKVESEKKINQLEAEKKNAELIAENNKLYYLSLGGFSLLLLLIIGLLWKNFKTQKHLTQEKEINYNQNLESLNNKKEMEVMQAMIDGEEAERKRIARDLHDGIGSRLSTIKMKLSQVTDLDNNVSVSKDFSTQLSNTIIELKQISYNLMPETLLKLGLEAALQDLCHSLRAEQVSINFQSNGIVKSISEKHQIAIFRIIQELINNALKHSNCTEIIVDCNQNHNLFLITVEDNGKGFKTNDLGKHTGLGLKNIKNRIDLLDGKLELKTSLGKGTVYNIELLLQI